MKYKVASAYKNVLKKYLVKNDYERCLIYRLIFTFLVTLTLQSCGFKLEAESVRDANAASKIEANNLFCISEDYEVCQYFKTQYPRSVGKLFDGIIEISLMQNKTTYTNWSDTGAPKISQSVVIVDYTIIENRQKTSTNKGIITGQINQNIPYQFGSSVISDLYAQRQSKKNAIDTLINIVNNLTDESNPAPAPSEDSPSNSIG